MAFALLPLSAVQHSGGGVMKKLLGGLCAIALMATLASACNQSPSGTSERPSGTSPSASPSTTPSTPPAASPGSSSSDTKSDSTSTSTPSSPSSPSGSGSK